MITYTNYIVTTETRVMGSCKHTNLIKPRPNDSKLSRHLLDYEQSLFFLSPSNKTRENTHARDWRRSPLDALSRAWLNEAKKETARSLSICKIWHFFQIWPHPTCRNTSQQGGQVTCCKQHVVSNMLYTTMLRCVALKCCDRLAGALAFQV